MASCQTYKWFMSKTSNYISFDILGHVCCMHSWLSACKRYDFIIMKLSNGNIFRATGPLWGEVTGRRWIPLTKASNAEGSMFSLVHEPDPQILVLVATWWRHQMETFSALLAICAGNSPVPGEFPTQRPVTRSFEVFFDLRLNKRLSKQSLGWWLETLSRPLWRHRNESRVN